MRKRDKNIKNLSDLIKFLSRDIGDYRGPIWFRGHGNKRWVLLPHYYRLKRISSETTLLKKFKQNATLLMNNTPVTTFDWLFVMQHHGVPTRLLDWTESPLIATYFAVSEKEKVDGTLWILLPHELNKNANIVPKDTYDIPSYEDLALKNYSPEVLESEKTSKLFPIAALATRNSSRMQAQLGVFTIHHREIKPIENIGDKKHIWRYNIPHIHKKKILKELKLFGITRFTLFPELESIGKTILQ